MLASGHFGRELAKERVCGHKTRLAIDISARHGSQLTLGKERVCGHKTRPAIDISARPEAS